jgi:hypothetical protein
MCDYWHSNTWLLEICVITDMAALDYYRYKFQPLCLTLPRPPYRQHNMFVMLIFIWQFLCQFFGPSWINLNPLNFYRSPDHLPTIEKQIRFRYLSDFNEMCHQIPIKTPYWRTAFLLKRHKNLFSHPQYQRALRRTDRIDKPNIKLRKLSFGNTKS